MKEENTWLYYRDVEDVRLWLPNRYNEAIIGIDCISYERLGYDIKKLNAVDDKWRGEYEELKTDKDFKEEYMPLLVDSEADPTGLKCYSGADDKIIGVIDGVRLAYTYEGMIEHFIEENGWTYEESMDWVEHNVLGTTSHNNEMYPIVFYEC